jgi:carbon monoxide dehydrogenase subunit G
MINVVRERLIRAPASSVFAALADPSNLAGIIPRVRRIELISQGERQAQVVTYMALGPFGEIRSAGDVRWQTDREVIFSAQRPVPVEAHWTLAPRPGGTLLQAALSLDLAPLLGLFAALVPAGEVAKMVGPDLDTALAAIAQRVEAQG